MATKIRRIQGVSTPATVTGIFYTCPATQAEVQAVTGEFTVDDAGRWRIPRCEACGDPHTLHAPA
jgi:hypothetical protein